MLKNRRQVPTHIAQGEFAIGSKPEDIIAATLGSCVAVCLYDNVANVGGMNHILLPDQNNIQVQRRFGSADMERLINAMQRHGADRSRLLAKVVGGASMLAGATEIGARNVEFCLSYLKAEGIRCMGQSVGGIRARQVKFYPFSGIAKQRFVSGSPEVPYQPSLTENSVEFFKR